MRASTSQTSRPEAAASSRRPADDSRDGGAASIALSVVIPYRNEEDSLPTLHAELSEVLDRLEGVSEILLVDDASTDEGPRQAQALAALDERIRLISLKPHAGQSAALQVGFRAARGEVVATMDADLQNDPADLPELLAGLVRADCVCGIRVGRQDDAFRRLASRVANAVRRTVLGDGITDVGCSLRVMRAEPLSRVKLFRGGHRFLPALLMQEGARVAEQPVRHRRRRYGTSKYGVTRRLAVVWLDLLGVLWLSRRTDRYEAKELSRRA